MNKRIIDRLDEYIEFKGINYNQVTVNAGLSNGLINKAKSGKSDLGKKAIEKILNFYHDLNRVWLLTGEGEMLKTNTSENILHEPSITYGKKKEDHFYEVINNLSATANRDSVNISELIETTKKMAETADRNSRTLEKLVNMLQDNNTNPVDSIEIQKGAPDSNVKGKVKLADK